MMRKCLIVGFSLLIFIVFAGQAQTTMMDNFKKAGEELLAKSNKELLKEKKKIDNYVKEMPKDSYISAKELRKLSKMINKFAEKKGELNEKLRIFSLSTSIEIDPRYTKIINVYRSYFKDHEEYIRKFFIGVSGHNVNVEDVRKDFVFGVVMLIIFFFVCIFMFHFFSKKANIFETILWSFLIYVSSFLFLSVGFLSIVLP